MATEKRCDVLRGREPAQQTPHVPFGWQVKSSRGFVKEEDLWTAHERPRNLNTPLHARAIGADQLASKLRVQANVVQDALDFLLWIWHVADTGKVRKVFARRPCGLTLTGFVAHQPNEPPDSERLLTDVVSPDFRGARARREQRGEHANGGGLSGAVEAQEPVELALRDF